MKDLISFRSSWGGKKVEFGKWTWSEAKKPLGWEAKHFQNHKNKSSCPNSTFFLPLGDKVKTGFSVWVSVTKVNAFSVNKASPHASTALK